MAAWCLDSLHNFRAPVVGNPETSVLFYLDYTAPLTTNFICSSSTVCLNHYPRRRSHHLPHHLYSSYRLLLLLHHSLWLSVLLLLCGGVLRSLMPPFLNPSTASNRRCQRSRHGHLFSSFSPSLASLLSFLLFNTAMAPLSAP